MHVALAATHHDPDGRLHQQTMRVLPWLRSQVSAIAISASHATHPPTLDLLAEAGVLVEREPPEQPTGLAALGRTRRAAVHLALTADTPAVLYVDWDRALHWAERYPDELARVLAWLPEHDLTVLGRTPRAFATHPRVQRDTEAIINHVYSLVSGYAWDVTAAARGLSRRAVEAILANCPDQAISTDVSWPLYLQGAGGFTLGYRAAEGLEFETADRYTDAIAAAGGRDQWLAQIDADPHAWAQRLHLARIEVDAAIRYAPFRPRV